LPGQRLSACTCAVRGLAFSSSSLRCAFCEF
jgi:hypothetical protein